MIKIMKEIEVNSVTFCQEKKNRSQLIFSRQIEFNNINFHCDNNNKKNIVTKISLMTSWHTIQNLEDIGSTPLPSST